MKNFAMILGVAVLLLLLVVVGPIFVIWAVNTLFPVAAIPYNIYTWAAVVILNAFFQVTVKIKK